MARKILIWGLLAVGLCANIGCVGANAQLARVQAENKKLVARLQEEKTLAQNLEVRNRELDRQLGDAEKQLAKLHDHGGQRMAEFKRPGSTDGASPSSTGTKSPSPLNAPLLNDAPLPSGGWVPKQSHRSATP